MGRPWILDYDGANCTIGAAVGIIGERWTFLVLREVFNKSDADSTAIMLHAHTHGMAVAGVYTFEVAETKVQETMALAEKAGLPLLCTMEPEDAPQ